MMLFDHTLSCCVSYLQFLILIVFTKVPRTKKKKKMILYFCSQRPCHVKVEKMITLKKGSFFKLFILYWGIAN